MTMYKWMTAMLGLCAMVFAAGCFSPPGERYRAGKEIEAGDYARAESRMIEVLDRNPADWEAHYLLGKTYLGQGRPVQAQSQLEQALAIKDRSVKHTPKILDALADSMHAQQHYEELYAFLDAQINRYEGWEDYARKARFIFKAGDIDGAALAYRQAAYFSRNEDAQIYVEIAGFYEGLGDYDKALQSLKWAYFIDDERTDLSNRFRKLGVVPGPTLKEQPPQPEYAGARLFALPKLIGD